MPSNVNVYKSLLVEAVNAHPEAFTVAERQQVVDAAEAEVAKVLAYRARVANARARDLVAGYYETKLWPEQRQQTWSDAHVGGY